MPSERNFRHSRAIDDLRRRGYGGRPTGPTTPERRRFLTGAAAGGLVLGLPPLLAACGGGGDDDRPTTAPGTGSETGPATGPVVGAPAAAGREVRTLFFNFTHVTASDSRHVLVVHGKRYPLTAVRDAPAVLAAARQDNAFLRLVPDDQITHHVEGVALATAITPLIYTTCDENPATGSWSMTGIAQLLPTTSVGTAYAKLRAKTTDGPLPLSAKRAFYGHPAATSARDLEEEQALVDPVDHARTLVTLHPDLLCAEPSGAHYIANQHVQSTGLLPGLLKRLGKATATGGWATLRPIVDPKTGLPYRNSAGLIQATPDWDPQVDQRVGNLIAATHAAVKDDTTLGRDVTGVPPPTDKSDTAFAGAIWLRHDGQASVRHAPSAASDTGGPGYTFATPSHQEGLVVGDPVVTTLDDGRKQITLGFTNWFLRFLGVYAQFTDANDAVIAVAALPAGTIPGRNTDTASLDKTNEVFLGVLPPAYTVAGIPVYGGVISQTIVMPLGASKVSFRLAGIGFAGSWDDPDELTLVGALMTGLINWALVALAMAVGVSTLDVLVKTAAAAATAVINELVVAVGAGLSFRTAPSAAAIGAFTGKLLQAIVGAVTVKALTPLGVLIAEQLEANNVIDEVPVAGEIARGIACAIGAISLAESLIEVACSPPLYAFELSLIRTVRFTLRPDPNDTGFPEMPPGYVLYHVVSLTFDSGVPHVQEPVDVPDPTVGGIAVAIGPVNRGGFLTVAVGFYARKTGTSPNAVNDFLAGKATAGPFPNLDDTPLADIAIDQTKIDITAKTVYLHTRRTALDGAGRHVWIKGATPPALRPLSSESTPGALAALRNITVRQGTSRPPQAGNVGYAWRAYSSGLTDCSAPGAHAQLDQIAGLDTDADGVERGRLASTCGLAGGSTFGASIGYSLLGGQQDLYFDSPTGHLRPVQLGGQPVISPSNGGQSLGLLNLDSAQLLMHPSGHVVSINNQFSKFEALKLPAQATDDATAVRTLKARTVSGTGSRPGLMRQPIAAAISSDGAVLVLEDGTANNRIQAFDVTGNPLPYFKQQKTPNFLQLDATEGMTYLDLAVEFSGFLYVLAQAADRSIRLDIYHAGQADTKPISTTNGLNAGRIAVDYWRSLYALNYEVLQLNGSVPRLTEPSVSVWLPSPPG